MDLNFRKLYASEIECRVAKVTERGCSLLLYKDARVDQHLLDEHVGTMNWQRKHEIIGGNLYCSVGIYDADKKEWIWKQDVGKESNAEKEKGQASDSFKRACFNWGIGRELYTAPFIWVTDFEKATKNGKMTVASNEKFTVQKITYNGNMIDELIIVNSAGKQVYPTAKRTYKEENKQEETLVQQLEKKTVKEILKMVDEEVQRTGKNIAPFLNYFQVESMEKLTKEQAGSLVLKYKTFPDKEKW